MKELEIIARLEKVIEKGKTFNDKETGLLCVLGDLNTIVFDFYKEMEKMAELLGGNND